MTKQSKAATVNPKASAIAWDKREVILMAARLPVSTTGRVVPAATASPSLVSRAVGRRRDSDQSQLADPSTAAMTGGIMILCDQRPKKAQCHGKDRKRKASDVKPVQVRHGCELEWQHDPDSVSGHGSDSESRSVTV
jgi:hypothetical protein